MNTNVSYALAGIIGLLIGGAAIHWWPVGSRTGQVYSTCSAVLPGDKNANQYGLFLTDGAQAVATGSIHFYNPGGYRHNVAILWEPSVSDSSSSPVTYDLGPPCTDDGNGPTATATMALINTQTGKQVSWLQFNSTPNTGSNATFGVKLTAYDSSGFPANTMTGDAYSMN